MPQVSSIALASSNLRMLLDWLHLDPSAPTLRIGIDIVMLQGIWLPLLRRQGLA